jgi:hypothetical protein
MSFPRAASIYLSGLDTHNGTTNWKRIYAVELANYLFDEPASTYAKRAPEPRSSFMCSDTDRAEVQAVMAAIKDGQDIEALMEVLAARNRFAPVTDEQVRRYDCDRASANLPGASRLPGVADYRKIYPAHWALEQIHTVTFPDAGVHLRIGARHTPYRAGSNADAMLCAATSPGKSVWNSANLRGSDAIGAATCRRCLNQADAISADASREADLVDAEADSLQVMARLLTGMSAARVGSGLPVAQEA